MSETPKFCVLLADLYALVQGESPGLLNEDSGGDSRLALAIEDALARAELEAAPAPVVGDAGLHGKYVIHRSRDGSPIDFPAFVLRLDGKDTAAIAAIRAYAGDPACPPELAADLLQHFGSATAPTPCQSRRRYEH